jgi:hypothetical protein
MQEQFKPSYLWKVKLICNPTPSVVVNNSILFQAQFWKEILLLTLVHSLLTNPHIILLINEYIYNLHEGRVLLIMEGLPSSLSGQSETKSSIFVYADTNADNTQSIGGEDLTPDHGNSSAPPSKEIGEQVRESRPKCSVDSCCCVGRRNMDI